MRESLKDRIRLEHIAEAADNISRYTSGKTYDDMLADDMMCYAVVYNILAIGEAAYHLTKAFQKEHPETACFKKTEKNTARREKYSQRKIIQGKKCRNFTSPPPNTVTPVRLKSQ